MTKELDSSQKKSTSQSKGEEILNSGRDFRSNQADNVSSTGLEFLNFVDSATAVACIDGGIMHPASPKKR